jgi:hypothetical protein
VQDIGSKSAEELGMKKSILIATFLVVGAGASSASALVAPYQGSDTLFNVTTQAIAAAALSPSNAYVGGGSGNGQSAMASKLQVTAPMSRMINNGGGACSYNSGTNGSADTNAAGIVVGLDAVDILSSTGAGAAAACNGTADNSGTGLAYSGTTGVFNGSNANQTWKWVLALIYGGKDLSPGGVTDCNSAARKALVANWSQMFQNGCANGTAACAAAPFNGALWHAYRRDDTSGTSDVFATILGLSPSTSNSAVAGFGTSPYCNAMNWDTSSGNAQCANGSHDQFTGPGGIVDPASACTIGGACGAAGSGNHRRPPVGTWGDNPDPSSVAKLAADVLPTQFQDNDPIRRACIGTTVNNHGRAGEEVCNIDGALGLVIPMVDSDWMLRLSTPLKQYPTSSCNTFKTGTPVNVFTCPIFTPTPRVHFGECPNGDQQFGGACLVPVDTVHGSSQCTAGPASVAGIAVRNIGSPDGRHYNVQMRDGTIVDGTIGYAQYNLPALGKTTDFAGGYNRIHQVETAVGPAPVACQLVDMTDQIGCLTQTDPCSIGYAGNGSNTWQNRSNPAIGSGGAVGTIGAMRVAQILPTTTTVQLLGQAGEYQVARKLYFNSLPGFANLTATASDTNTADEVTLAADEANPVFMNPIITANDFFTLGAQSPAGTDNQFCEDFNEQVVCNPTPTAASTLPANVNGCAGNPAGIPTASTICGDGVKGPYEECDNGTANGTTGNHCSQTCRCTLDFNEGTGACN